MRTFLLHLAYRLYHIRWWITRPIIMGVRIMLVRDGQVIMVRHTYQNYWFFPGGSLKRNETLAQAAKREAFEEVGAVVHGEPWLMGVYLYQAGHKSDHIALFVSEDFTLTAEATDRWEIAAWSFFPMDALPADQWPGSRERVEEYLGGALERGVGANGQW